MHVDGHIISCKPFVYSTFSLNKYGLKRGNHSRMNRDLIRTYSRSSSSCKTVWDDEVVLSCRRRLSTL